MIPDLLQIVNTSLLSGVFPQAIKTAVIKPLLKERTLDTSVMNNYRPISSLPILNKIIEKAVFQQLNNYLIIRLKVSAQLQSVMLKTTDQTRNLGVIMDSDIRTQPY